MMLSPSAFIRQYAGSSLEECIALRDQLISQLKEFEKNPDYSSDTFPCPLSEYLVCTDYLKELCDLIAQKIRSHNI
ncbi:MAG: hypothetical protein K6A70_07685 [Erysipelotrichaceae bacterium]|jgi:hypothetical protein|nr:hypothetical protein [Erysipelotrichaceae bacterium]